MIHGKEKENCKFIGIHTVYFIEFVLTESDLSFLLLLFLNIHTRTPISEMGREKWQKTFVTIYY